MGKTAMGLHILKIYVVIKQGRVLHGQMKRAYLTCLFDSSWYTVLDPPPTPQENAVVLHEMQTLRSRYLVLS